MLLKIDVKEISLRSERLRNWVVSFLHYTKFIYCATIEPPAFFQAVKGVHISRSVDEIKRMLMYHNISLPLETLPFQTYKLCSRS